MRILLRTWMKNFPASHGLSKDCKTLLHVLSIDEKDWWAILEYFLAATYLFFCECQGQCCYTANRVPETFLDQWSMQYRVCVFLLLMNFFYSWETVVTIMYIDNTVQFNAHPGTKKKYLPFNATYVLVFLLLSGFSPSSACFAIAQNNVLDAQFIFARNSKFSCFFFLSTRTYYANFF